MAIVQLRRTDTAGRVFLDRKRGEGKSAVEAWRALKRRLSNVVHRQVLADAVDRMSPVQLDPTPGLGAEDAVSRRCPGGSKRVLAQQRSPRHNGCEIAEGHRWVGDGKRDAG